MTTPTNAFGQLASGITRVVDCPSWCDDPGHGAATARHDQTCWSDHRYVHPTLEEVHTYFGGPTRTDWEVSLPRIGPCAYRGFNEHPVVYLHIELPGFRQTDGLDTSCKFTAAEARELADALYATANLIDGEMIG